MRTLLETYSASQKLEGAGVHLHRGFGHPHVPRFDPFLLFDDFSSENPVDYLPGFPMHPHRGIETVTYILGGEVEHEDSIGTRGKIGKGDVQWMTAGSGIMHQEMPKGDKGLKGFQLWVNLPSDKKLTKPRYQEVKSREIPEISYGKNAVIRVISGQLDGVDAPISEIYAQPVYFDIKVTGSDEIEIPIPSEYNAFVYVFESSIHINDSVVMQGHVGLLNKLGNSLKFGVGSSGARLLLAAGKPLDQPIAWYGPIVMNTKEELVTAVQDLRSGTFVK